MQRMRDTVLILDNSCLRHLVDADVMAKLAGSLRSAGVRFFPSEINVLEALGARPADRVELLRILTSIGGYWLVPWTFRLLRQVGLAVAANEPLYTLGDSRISWMLTDTRVLTANTDDVRAWTQGLEKNFAAMHDGAAKELEPKFKASGMWGHFDDARAFLDQYWNVHGMREWIAELIWKTLRLPGEAPVAKLLQAEVWKIAVDAEGFALYERVFAVKKRKRVHRPDLLQLIYLGLADRRIICTGDRPFLEGAQTLIKGRYNNARAMHISELLDLAGVEPRKDVGASNKVSNPAAKAAMSSSAATYIK